MIWIISIIALVIGFLAGGAFAAISVVSYVTNMVQTGSFTWSRQHYKLVQPRTDSSPKTPNFDAVRKAMADGEFDAELARANSRNRQRTTV